MKAVKFFVKRKYLVKVVITCTALILIPFILFSYAIISRSYNELLNANEEYYKKTTDSFSKYFQSQLTDIQMNALRVGEDGKEMDSPLKLSVLKSNPYYFKECIDLMIRYNSASKYPMGIYYYDTGYLFTKDTSNTKETFIKRYLNIQDKEEMPELQDFFTYDPQKRLKLFSTFSDSSANQILLVGVTVRIGYTQDKALVFYMLDSSSINISLFLSQSSSDMQFYIVDSNSDSLLYTTAPRSESFTVKDIHYALDKNDASYYQNNGMRYNVYHMHDSTFGRDYISFFPFNAVENSAYQFYVIMRRMAFAASFVFLFLICTMVYLNYRPIQKIMRKLSKNTSLDELSTISSAFDKMINEMSEQNLLIMDFLLGNILCGTPIPTDEKDNLGISNHVGCFCVCTVEGVIFNTELRTTLINKIAERFHITAYITDIFGLDRIVIILLLKDDETSEIITYIKSRLSAYFSRPYELKTGIVVKSINDIQKSYASCLKINSRTESFDDNPEMYKQVLDSIDLENKNSSSKIQHLKDEVIEYVQQNFTDPSISQISVADHFGISIYSLSRLFKNYIGQGFSEYITANRLECAKNLLLNTDKTVNVISNEIGIQNVTYFYRLFGSNLGVTPMKFRNSMGRITR